MHTIYILAERLISACEQEPAAWAADSIFFYCESCIVSRHRAGFWREDELWEAAIILAYAHAATEPGDSRARR